MDTKEPDSRLSVRKEDLDDQELYRLNQVINDLYSKVASVRQEPSASSRKPSRSGVIRPSTDVSSVSTGSTIPPAPETGIPQPDIGDWSLDSVIYSIGEDGLQYGFASASILNKPASVGYYSMFIQDLASGYANTSGTSVSLTPESKSAGVSFEGCESGQTVNINLVAYTISATPVAPFDTITLSSSAGTQSNVYFNLNPIDGKWEEIASDAEAGTWQPRPPFGWDVPCAIAANTNDQKTPQPANGSNYKRLVFSPWGVASQVSSFSVTVEQQTQAGVLSGRFLVNFTKPVDPEYYYASIERLLYINNTFSGQIGATARVDVNSSTNVITYNGTTFSGQNFSNIQAGDTVYLNTGSSISDSDAYTVSEFLSSTQVRLTTTPAGSPSNILFAQWSRIAGEVDSFKQSDYWPLPSNEEYWKFRARSVNYREIANNTTPPSVNVTVPNSSGVTSIAPGTITTAAFASTIRPVDLITTPSMLVTSIVVLSNTGTVTTSSPHGLTGTRQVSIFNGTGTSSKLNGLYVAFITGASTFTITTSGVLDGTYSSGMSEVPLPSLPSSTYPSGAVGFMTANTKLYRSSGSLWTIASDGSDIVANSITAGQIAAGAISTTELFAGEILVGQGGGKPSRFTVVDSSSNTIGFIGDTTSPISFTGGYFKNLLVAPSISTTATPRLYATSAGLLELVGMNIEATNAGTTGFDGGTVAIKPGNLYGAVQVSNSSINSLSAMGPNYLTVRSDNPSNWYPYCELYRTSTFASVRAYGGPSFSTTDSVFQLLVNSTPASSYANFARVPIQINGTTVIDINRNGSFVNLEITGTLTAGGSVGTSGQVLSSTGTGIQWVAAGAASAAGSTGQIQFNTSGTLDADADLHWDDSLKRLGVGTATPQYPIHARKDQTGFTWLGVSNQAVSGANAGLVCVISGTNFCTFSQNSAGDTRFSNGSSTGQNIFFATGGADRWGITGAGILNPQSSDTLDIGVLATNRVRAVYAQKLDTAQSGSAGDSVRTRKLELYDNTGSNTIPSFWDLNAVSSGVGAFSESYCYLRDNSGNKVFQAERVRGGSGVDRTYWFTDLLPDSNLSQSLGSASTKWQIVYANQLGTNLDSVVVWGGNSSFTQISCSGYIKGTATTSYFDTDFNTAGQSPYRLRGSALVDNGGVWVSAGGVNMNAGCAATGYNIFGGGTGQTVTVNFSGGFTIGGTSYNNLIFTGGVLTSYS
jgi:hypothetical protein